MKKSILPVYLALTFLFTAITLFSNAQGIIGSWKKKDEVLTKENGKTKSTFEMLVKNMPCFANIVYTFYSGGKMDEQANGCAVPLQAQIKGTLKNSHWKVAGGKLTIDVADKGALAKHAEYQIEFVGADKMVWTFNYAENPGVPNFTKAKQMRTTYARL